ncbi:MAG: hypothetical protein U0Z17_07255 [Bacteroidales bacterium]
MNGPTAWPTIWPTITKISKHFPVKSKVKPGEIMAASPCPTCRKRRYAGHYEVQAYHYAGYYTLAKP